MTQTEHRGPGLPVTTADDAVDPERRKEARRLANLAAVELGLGVPIRLYWYRRQGPAAPAYEHRAINGVARHDATGATPPLVYLATDLQGAELARTIGHEAYHLAEFRRGRAAHPAQEFAAERFAHDFAARRAPPPDDQAPEDWRGDSAWRQGRMAILEAIGAADTSWEYAELRRLERAAQAGAVGR